MIFVVKGNELQLWARWAYWAINTRNTILWKIKDGCENPLYTIWYYNHTFYAPHVQENYYGIIKTCVTDKWLPVLIPPLPLPWSTRCITLELIHEHNGHIGSEQKPHTASARQRNWALLGSRAWFRMDLSQQFISLGFRILSLKLVQ